MHPQILQFVVVSSLLAVTAMPLTAQELDVRCPGQREFVSDEAGMLDPDSTAQLRSLCDKLLTDKAIPIIVVTIDSKAVHGGENMTIETFSALLFNQWRIGHATLDGQYWNTGILLLVSKGDRSARIQPGAGWGVSDNSRFQQIMDEHIMLQFRQGRFSEGIVAGVTALDKMARGLKLPTRPRSSADYAIPLAITAVVIFTTVSLSRRGTSGWAWLLWSGLFAAVWSILSRLSDGDHSSDSGWFSGGSFDSGSAGDSGASGSW